MNALKIALLCASLASVAFGQSSKLREIAKIYSSRNDFFAQSEALVMPQVSVTANRMRSMSDRAYSDLYRRFTPSHAGSVSIVSESANRPGFGSGLKESVLAEFAMAGARDLKALKGGVEVDWFGGHVTTTIYAMKSGIAWHPKGHRHLTYVLGPKSSWRYRFKNEEDVKAYVIRRPVEGCLSFVERKVELLWDKVFR